MLDIIFGESKRIGQADFYIGVLLYVGPFVVLMMSGAIGAGSSALLLLLFLALAAFTVFAVGKLVVRRGRDFGVPTGGSIAFAVASLLFLPVILVWGLVPGNPDANAFGAPWRSGDPDTASSWAARDAAGLDRSGYGSSAGHDGSAANHAPGADDFVANDFTTGILGMVAKLAKADGHVSREELRVVNAFLRDDLNLDADGVAALQGEFNRMKSDPRSFDTFARMFHTSNPHGPTAAIAVHDLLIRIAVADGHLAPEEARLLRKAAAIMGLDDRARERYESWNEDEPQDRERQSGSQQSEAAPSPPSERDRAREVLGVSADATAAEIRTAWVQRCKEYHPDNVRTLGPKLQAFAEEEMKAVNAAYAMLKS